MKVLGKDAVFDRVGSPYGKLLEKSEQMEAVLQLISALYHIILKKVI